MARVAGDASIDSVKAFLSRAKSAVSEGDVAAGTGLDAGTAKRALYALMRSHRCSLAVHDDGRLFMTYTAITYGDTDRYGYAHRRYEPTPPVMRPKPPPHDKSFIASVYDFVIGPTRVEPPPRAQEQEVAAFVRQNGGVLTVRDVQTLSGMPRKQAEQFFARFVAEQDGVAEVTEDGALYATFDELLRSKSREHDAPSCTTGTNTRPPSRSPATPLERMCSSRCSRRSTWWASFRCSS
ncbi:MAG TPA: hypothetical protein VFB62_20660 [Polyangiaceae bacterium]|nr:hypothetical protein [Polyangiaceae bacterium]